MLIIGLALSIAALFVNPVGFKQVIYPLDVMFNQSTGLGSVDEWQPLRFNDVRAFGIAWEDCEELLRKLGFLPRVEVVAA